jgi:hypothetical protein
LTAWSTDWLRRQPSIFTAITVLTFPHVLHLPCKGLPEERRRHAIYRVSFRLKQLPKPLPIASPTINSIRYYTLST